MTDCRTYKRLFAILALLVFLSQNALALAMPPVMAGSGHDMDPAAGPSVSVNAHAGHHAHPHDQTADAELLTEASCEQASTCLCCIGSCASALTGDADRVESSINDTMALTAFHFLPSRIDESPFRPPIIS